MISGGDEYGRSQGGNNNAYCQDNEIAWLDWGLDKRRRQWLEFVKRVLAVRRENPVFRRRRFFAGNPVTREGPKDVSWVRPDGKEMELADWHDSKNRVLGMMIPGQASDEVDERGRPNRGATLLLLLNSSGRSRFFQLPILPEAGVWREIVNTARPGVHEVTRGGVNLVAHSLMLVRREAP
jgi:glycogen operon protein